MKKFKIQNKRIIIIVVVMAIAMILLFCSIYYWNNTIYGYSYLYNSTQNSDYKVYLKQNNYLKQDFLEKDKVYISKIVDYIEIDFNYDFNGSKLENLNYLYDITATLIIDYSNTGENLLEKSEYIIKNKFLEVDNTNKVNVSETISIDYDVYAREVEKFKQEFGLPVTAYLMVDFKIKTQIQLSENLDILSNSQLKINLGEPIMKISIEEADDESETMLETKNIIENSNQIILWLSILLLIVLASALIIEISKIQKEKNKDIDYQVEKILQKYGDIIIELKQDIKLKENDLIVEVKNFEQLLELEEEVREPILYYKNEDGIHNFNVVNHSIIYVWNNNY